jgi:hypothetical protein
MPTIAYPRSNTLRCSSTKSMALEYTPNKGYTGNDSIEIEAINNLGQRNTFTYNITVK